MKFIQFCVLIDALLTEDRYVLVIQSHNVFRNLKKKEGLTSRAILLERKIDRGFSVKFVIVLITRFLTH